jgi:hypothetical protein
VPPVCCVTTLSSTFATVTACAVAKTNRAAIAAKIAPYFISILPTSFVDNKIVSRTAYNGVCETSFNALE